MAARTRSRTLIAVATGATVLGLLAPTYAAAVPTPNPSPSGPVGGPRMGEVGTVIVDLSRGATPPPVNDAVSYVVADVTTGEILAAKNPHERLRPASTLKTLTLLAVIPELKPDLQYVAVYDDAAQDGSKVGLVPGASYSVNDLLHGMMLPSGNDAAHALGNAVGGALVAADLLNAEARRIGAFDTVAVNTSGLEAEGQVSSAYDLALVQANGVKNSLWRQVYGTVSYDFPAGPVPEGTPRPTYKTYTKNKLVLNGYPGTIGGKTGYTEAALRTFVATVERDGHVLVATFMRYIGDTEVTATSMFDWAFANRALLKPVGDLVTPEDVAPKPSPESTPSTVVEPQSGDETSAGETSGEASEESSPSWMILAGTGLLLVGSVVVIGGVVRRRPRRRKLTLPPI